MYKRLLGGLILIFILSSCQPTPDQESVISKADDYLAVANEDTTETFSAPSEYKKEYDHNAKVLVCFDATVSYNKGPYPILRVLPRKFSETELLSICNYLQPNVPIYEEIDDTKAEIMEQLTSLQTYNGDLGGFLDLSETEEIQQELTERWNAASGEPTLSPYVYCYMVLDSAGGADGSFGPKTEDAVMYFQKQQGLTQDGLVGKNTWGALSHYVYFTGTYEGGYPLYKVGKNTWGALSHYVYFTGTYEGGCPLYKVRSMPGSSLMYTVFRRVSSTHWQYRKPVSSSWYDIVNN